jgi:hypothetical protein
MKDILPTKLGFELEFSMSGTDVPSHVQQVLEQKGYSASSYHGYRKSYTTTRWDIKLDGSCGYEAASPVISTFTDLVKQAAVAKLIKEERGSVNNRCGLHFHMEIKTMSVQVVVRLFRLLLRYEPAFFQLADPSRRDNQYCLAINASVLNKFKQAVKLATSTRDLMARVCNFWPTKNSWINPMTFQTVGTLEVRLMQSTLDPEFIVKLGLFLSHIVEAAINGQDVTWGLAKAKDNRSLVYSFLAACGFYQKAEWVDQERAQLARRWAIKQFNQLSKNGTPPSGTPTTTAREHRRALRYNRASRTILPQPATILPPNTVPDPEPAILDPQVPLDYIPDSTLTPPDYWITTPTTATVTPSIINSNNTTMTNTTNAITITGTAADYIIRTCTSSDVERWIQPS